MSKFLKMVEQFQCPGCVCGSDTQCGKFKANWDNACGSHVAGTYMYPSGHILLGMPKGFNKTGRTVDDEGQLSKDLNKAVISFYTKDMHDQAKSFWNRLNVPVWASEKDGHLFVRVFMPRINATMVQVIEDGTLAMVHEAGFQNVIDPSTFEDTFD